MFDRTALFTALTCVIAALALFVSDHVAAEASPAPRRRTDDQTLKELEERIALLQARHELLTAEKAAARRERSGTRHAAAGATWRGAVAMALTLSLAAVWPATDTPLRHTRPRARVWSLVIPDPVLESRFTAAAFRAAYTPLVIFLAAWTAIHLILAAVYPAVRDTGVLTALAGAALAVARWRHLGCFLPANACSLPHKDRAFFTGRTAWRTSSARASCLAPRWL